MQHPNTIRVLAVRQPWASYIVEGFKQIELRSVNTNIRERVAIYASRTTIDSDFVQTVNIWKQRGEIFPIGKILGTVEITGSELNKGKHDFEDLKDKHISPERYFDARYTHFWYLRNPVKFDITIPYKPPKGAVVWSKTELPEGY